MNHKKINDSLIKCIISCSPIIFFRVQDAVYIDSHTAFGITIIYLNIYMINQTSMKKTFIIHSFSYNLFCKF